MDSGEDGVGPVVGELAVDASDLVVAPFVRCCPAPVILRRSAGTAGYGAIGAELLLDGLEPRAGLLTGSEKGSMGPAGLGAELAQAAGLGELAVDAAELVPRASRCLLASLCRGRETGVRQ